MNPVRNTMACGTWLLAIQKAESGLPKADSLKGNQRHDQNRPEKRPEASL
jgi:hypothetical protein